MCSLAMATAMFMGLPVATAVGHGYVCRHAMASAVTVAAAAAVCIVYLLVRLYIFWTFQGVVV